MRSVVGYLRWGMGQRLGVPSLGFTWDVSSAIAAKSTILGVTLGEAEVAPSVMLTARRHISSFKGTPQEFIDIVSRDKAAIVYFYAGWCEPCNRLTAKLERLAEDVAFQSNSDHSEALSAADASVSSAFSPSSATTASDISSYPFLSSPSPSPSSSSSSTSRPISSCSCSQPSTEDALRPSNARAASEPTFDGEVVLKNTCKLYLPTRVNGETVCILPVDTDENPKLGALHDIRSIPTLVAYRRGRVVGRVEGPSEQELRKLVHDLKQDNERDTPADSTAAGESREKKGEE